MVSDTEEPADDDESPSVDLPSLLYYWERIVAAVLGAGGAFFGCRAVFTTSNQAGSAVLLLISAAFLLIGIQGTPLTKLTSGSNTLELEKRRISERLIRKARKEEDPEVAQAYEEAALVVQGNPPAPKPLAEAALRYEQRVMQAFHRIGIVAQPASELDSPIDFIAIKGEARAAVMVKYRRHMIGIKEIEEASNAVTRSGLSLMIVTNAPLSSKVQEFNSTWGDRHPRAEVVTWRNETSDPQLLRVYIRTAHP